MITGLAIVDQMKGKDERRMYRVTLHFIATFKGNLHFTLRVSQVRRRLAYRPTTLISEWKPYRLGVMLRLLVVLTQLLKLAYL